jgi:AmmeMemoRadiSam system protein B
MRLERALLAIVLPFCSTLAQATPGPVPADPPTLEAVRSQMGIPSVGLELRGQRDAVGFASTPEQMAKIWELAGTPPAPLRFGTPPAPGVAGVIAPHDDYLYAGRIDREIFPLVTARTVVLVGVFHGYRRFGIRDRLVFDPYAAWRTPDGNVPVSPLRQEILAKLPAGDFVQDAAAHDSEHSVEAAVYWLRHARPDLEIVPILVPAAGFERLDELAGRLAAALAGACKTRGLALGKDVAIVISADAVHYGADFRHVPYGEGGIEAYERAVRRDESILRSLDGPLSRERTRKLFATFVDPERPDDYRLTWCGRFSIPFGLLLLEKTAAFLDAPRPVGRPVAYATSVGLPELPVRDLGLDRTAPANLYHFVGLPAVAF